MPQLGRKVINLLPGIFLRIWFDCLLFSSSNVGSSTRVRDLRKTRLEGGSGLIIIGAKDTPGMHLVDVTHRPVPAFLLSFESLFIII